MTVFETLFMAHLLGDWILQTEWQAQNKAKNGRALLTHVLVYHAVMLVFVSLRMGFPRGDVFLIVALLGVTHAFLDRDWPVQRLMRMLRIIRHREVNGWLDVVIDQSVHILLLGAAALILS